MESVSSSGSETKASPEPSSHQPPSEVPPLSSVDAIQTTDNSNSHLETWPSQRQEVIQGETTEIEAETLPDANNSRKSPQKAQTGGDAGIKISRVVLTKTSKHNPAIHNKLLRLARLEEEHKGAVLHNPRSVGPDRNGQTAKSPDKDTDRAEWKAMQQQLQHLTKQVKLLKEALDERTAKAAPTAQSATRSVAAKPDEDTSQTSSGEESVRAQPSLTAATTTTTKTMLPATRRVLHTKSGGSQVLDRAMYRYRRSTSELVNTANELHECMPILGASIVALIQRRLTVIGRDAILENDPKTIERLRPYKKRRFLDVAMRDSKDVSLAKRTYRRSAIALVEIVKSLEKMTSQAAAHIAVMIRDRLALMIQEAVSDHDVQMRQALLSTKMFKWHDPAFGKLATLTMVPLIRKVPLETHADRRAQSKSVASPELQAEKESVSFHATPSNLTREKVDRADASQNAQVFESIKDRAAPVKKIEVETDEPEVQKEDDEQKIMSDDHTQSRSMKLSDTVLDSTSETIQERQPIDTSTKSLDPKPTNTPKESSVKTDAIPSRPAPSQSDEVSEHSLFEELFPEATVSPPVRTAENREHVPKLNLPEPSNLIRQKPTDSPKNVKDQVVQSFVKRGEDITALQLEHCSTELTEFDFRRLIIKGKHIDAWNSDGAFYKVIPGRDPLSLERLPFYYLLFRSPEAAHAYQKNAGRLHKLAALHQPSNIFSAIPPPKGFLEDGEDIDAITSSYVLKPTGHSFSLRTVMQPYHPALGALFKQGGYKPIVPDTDNKRNRIHKVLMHIEGYEPSLSDLFKILRQDAWRKSMLLPLRNESSSSIHRLRDVINLKTHLLPIATTNPRAYDHRELSGNSGNTKLEFDDPNIAHFMKSDSENPQDINQIVMNRVYNRWILEFDDEDEARRFAIAWHRRPLPNVGSNERTWKDYEEVRICNCELLW